MFFVTSRLTGYTMEFDYLAFIKWYDNVWHKNKIMENYFISGCKNLPEHYR